ncbi:MAG: TetR family transcriptional regulator C-terminal domain-containing protein [Alphaproteobacteria bacterium]|nr:TetR family transcriptional regulator C-terminal domain-containing protein [Alphaproteobacteria bacterium]MBU1279186.1 TetR family transcriptional regulator C-terminal domain-containing protein [Alphaproteobacteria bacterium]MBU1574832.1 TetR family transcriptional regulator C-terminal domain-containing protein [Alphaproteobacteria bacterium]MBU1829062.1 TetR family transcriptional regulator C-terminal domain-containing protein [Alphaproteobacteria bacterium]MBU2077513.1 TetR family transcri
MRIEPKMPGRQPRTRIQKKNTETILEAALEVFSQHGFRGATLDQIAKAAGLSKPNLLYYFPSKVAIHRALIDGLMKTWLDPLREMKADGDPVEEVIAYVLRKLEMAREFPRESRLFANEIVQGAPNIMDKIEGELKNLVEEKAAVIEGWIEQGQIAPCNPYHLIFSIWSTTQHYADFDAQIRGILHPEGDAHFEQARHHLETLFRRMLTP